MVRGGPRVGPATVAIRPEDVEVLAGDDRGPGADGEVVGAGFLGDHYRYRIRMGSADLDVHTGRRLGSGPVRVRIPPGAATFVD